MSWPHLGVVRVVTVFDTNENRGKECEGLGKITERKGFENQFLTLETSSGLLSQLSNSWTHSSVQQTGQSVSSLPLISPLSQQDYFHTSANLPFPDHHQFD